MCEEQYEIFSEDEDDFLVALEITHDILASTLDPTHEHSLEEVLSVVQTTCGNLAQIINRIHEMKEEVTQEIILEESMNTPVVIH